MTFYEKILLSTLSFYKLTRDRMDVLQMIFLKSLPFVMLPVLFSYVLQVTISDNYFVMTGFFIVSLLLASPFIVAVIRLALKKEAPKSYFSTLVSGISAKVLFMSFVVVGIAGLALLPYFSATMLVQFGVNEIIFSSNLFSTYMNVVYGFAVVVTVFMAVRVMGMIVSYESKNPEGLADIFKKTQGHFFAIMLIILAAIIPAELLTQSLLWALSGLYNIVDSLIWFGVVYIVSSFVRAAGFLFELYVVWMALALYMKNQKLVS